jgi:DNA-directed RNA polymerase specialized sigma subunit
MKYEDYVGTIKKLATKYQSKSVHLDDLMSEGGLVFCESEKAYSPSFGVKFNTFLYTNLNNRFYNMRRDSKNKVKGGACSLITTYHLYGEKGARQDDTEDFIAEISQDISDGANEIVNFICNTSDTILTELNVGTISKQGLRITRKGLKRYFTKVKNWRHREWVKSSQEIKKYLVERI